MNFFRERCSMIGEIMGNPRSKADKELGLLNQTAKTRVEEVFISSKFDREKDIDNKYMRKGIRCEDESIFLFKNIFGDLSLFKNEKFYENDFITGTPDLLTEEFVIDIKTSWDIFTFGKMIFKDKIPNDTYFYQLQGYMWLTGRKKAILAYCLTDDDEETIQTEVRRKYYNSNNIDLNSEEMSKIDDEIRKQKTFSDIDQYHRIKTFHIDYCEETIEKIKHKIKKCNEYYLMLNQKLKEQHERNRRYVSTEI